jgi:hypothetical protein
MSASKNESNDRQVRLSAESLCLDIVQFWNEIAFSDDTGAADRGVLESMSRDVTEALNRRPPDLKEAESLTCRAFLLITGDLDC